MYRLFVDINMFLTSQHLPLAGHVARRGRGEARHIQGFGGET